MSEPEVYRMKIIQSGWNNRVRGMPYRIIDIPDDCTLYKFAEIITDLFEFDFDHAFGFYSEIKNHYRSPESYELFKDMGEDTTSKGVKRTHLKKVFRELKKKWLFLYDYGDEWHFIIEKIRDMKYDPKEDYYKLIRSEKDPLPQYPDTDE